MANKKIKASKISFADLKKYDDSTSAVLMATDFPADQDFNEVSQFLANDLGFSREKNLTGVYLIEGNVTGRHDWLLTFDNPSKTFNPLARLRFPDLKWTSDYIDNYVQDYE